MNSVNFGCFWACACAAEAAALAVPSVLPVSVLLRPDGTVAEALAAEGLGAARVATALNGDFVPAALRATTVLSPGDALEVVAPMQGG